MTKIGLFYGTQTGYTQTDAEIIQKKLGGDSVVELIDIEKAEVNDFGRFENIIIGCPMRSPQQLRPSMPMLLSKAIQPLMNH